YVITIPSQPGVKKFIEELKRYTSKSEESNEEIEKGFVRGMFLGCGYIKSPEKEYALDFFVDNDMLADELYNFLIKLEKRVYKTVKRNKPLVYMRNAEDIMDIIVLIGSMKEFYNYEETTMIKDLKNKTIREMNWEVANETKTLDTARKQIKMINVIGKMMGLNNLSPVLEEIAFLRLENPEASLQELGEIIGISKSGIRNRFRRLEDTHNELIEKEREA
ncbi:MAG: DNA-binding protein WhiA, partial [Cetobacterium sp.]